MKTPFRRYAQRSAASSSSSPSSLCRFVALSLIFFSLNCASNKSTTPTPAQPTGKLNQWLARQPSDVPTVVYRVAPPDKLRIVAPGIKEINDAESVIRPDGTIELNLVGSVKVNGLTPAEISEALAQRLAAYYRVDTIDISVQVKEFKSQHYYVFGQVEDPGIKPYTGRDTILQVLATAQLNNDAWPQRIVIVRPNEDTSIHQRVTVDVKEMYENGKSTQNFLLEAGDVVYVPLSPVAEVARTFKRVLGPIVPATQLGMIAVGGI